MNMFKRLPGFTRTPAGKERLVLRMIPKVYFYGSLLLAIPSLLARLIAAPENTQAIMTTDIYVISLVILHWTVVVTVAIAAFIIMLMKGPAYVADAYPLDEDESLEPRPERDRHVR